MTQQDKSHIPWDKKCDVCEDDKATRKIRSGIQNPRSYYYCDWCFEWRGPKQIKDNIKHKGDYK